LIVRVVFRLGRRPREKLLATMFATKIESLTVLRGAPSGRFIYCHAANRVNRHDEITLQCADWLISPDANRPLDRISAGEAR
jgi:hypothetical protein